MTKNSVIDDKWQAFTKIWEKLSFGTRDEDSTSSQIKKLF